MRYKCNTPSIVPVKKQVVKAGWLSKPLKQAAFRDGTDRNHFATNTARKKTLTEMQFSEGSLEHYGTQNTCKLKPELPEQLAST